MSALAVFDLETTGVDVETDRIVTAFFGVLNADGTLRFGLDYTVKPDGYIIPDEATAIHGVTTEQALAEGQPLVDVLKSIADHMMRFCRTEALPLVGHNLSYDLTLFDREAQRAWDNNPNRKVEILLRGVNVLDTYVLDKHYEPYRKGKRTLTVTAERYGVTLSEAEAHGARADAIASGRIIQAMGREYSALRHHSPSSLQDYQAKWKREQAASLQDYLRTKADPPTPDAIVDGHWPFIPRATDEGQFG